MNQIHTPQIAANCSPVFSMAGVMPAASNMAWKTAYPNPDAGFGPVSPAGHGPSFSVAGVMPGHAETAWRTAMPNPDRDVLDAHGYAITKIEARTRAELASGPRTRSALGHRTNVLALPVATAT